MPHNGGKSQVNINAPQYGGDYPFINHYKNGQDIFYSSGQGYPDPDTLNAKGYPISLAHGGIGNLFFIPALDDRPGNYVVKWKGPTASRVILGTGGTIVSGSDTAPSTNAGRFVFTPADFAVILHILSLGVDDVVCCHADDEALHDAGEVFGVKFKQRLIEGNFGSIRHLNTQACNTSNVGQWKHRKPVNYIAYGTREYRPGIFAGLATRTGSAWVIGNTPDGFVLEDKTTVIFRAPDGGSSGAEPYTLNVNGTGARPMVQKYCNLATNPYATIWTAVYDAMLNVWITEEGGINNMWPVELCVRLCAEVGAHCHMVSPTYAYETTNDYWHTGFATYVRDNKPSWMTVFMEGPNETWNFSGGCNQVWYADQKQLKRNGGQSYPYIDPNAQFLTISAMASPSVGSGVGYFDLTLSDASHLNIGASLQLNDMDNHGFLGLSYSPVWVTIKNVGGNPNKITVKYYAPFFAGGSYTSGGTATPIAFDYHAWYGRGLSQMGAAWAAVFGTTRGWPHYAITCGVQTAYASYDGEADGSHRERMLCTGYAIEGGTPAFTYVDAVTPASYYNPTTSWTLGEVEDAFNYCVTSRSNSTTKAALLANYVNACNTPGVSFGLPSLLVYWGRWKSFAQSYGIQHMLAYEGGYSPDFMPVYFPIGDYYFGSMSAVTGASKASSCVLTLGTTQLAAGNFTFPSTNPIKVGMLLHTRSIVGMTQLNCDCATGVLFTGGGSTDITYTGAIVPVVGQGILITPLYNSYGFGTFNRFPAPLEIRVPYYVVYSSGTTIRISATKGGAPINFATATTVDNGLGAITGWFVTNKSGQSITIDVNSTGFGTWAAGGAQWAHVAASDDYMNMLRSFSKRAPELYDINMLHFTNFVSLTGGSFMSMLPSNFVFTGLGSKHLGNRGYDGDIWSIQNDLYQLPDSPQFASAKVFNTGAILSTAMDFPNTPALGDRYLRYSWDGVKWRNTSAYAA